MKETSKCNSEGEGWGRGMEVGLVRVERRGGEKMQTTVIEQQ